MILNNGNGSVPDPFARLWYFFPSFKLPHPALIWIINSINITAVFLKRNEIAVGLGERWKLEMQKGCSGNVLHERRIKKKILKWQVLHYVHISLIYNSQKLEKTQMPFNRKMDTENVVHLHNGILLSYQKQWLYEIHRQMDGTENYHPEWGNPITGKDTWYALIDKWLLAQMLNYPRCTEQMKLKKDDQNANASVLL